MNNTYTVVIVFDFTVKLGGELGRHFFERGTVKRNSSSFLANTTKMKAVKNSCFVKVKVSEWTP